jgi:hypothetical protein
VDAIIFSRVWSPLNIRIALENARRHCPECRIVHHHDGTSGVGWDDAVDMTQSFEESKNFCWQYWDVYGVCHPELEIPALCRWKMLLDWMKQNGFQRASLCDSDVLLFDNPFTTPHYVPGRLMLSSDHTSAAHAGNSVVTVEALEEFWRIAVSVIQNPGEHKGGVNDMLIWAFTVGKFGGYEDQNRVINGVAWDHHMGWTDGWENDGNGYKKITWQNNKPHCKYLETGEDVRLVNLHCWGKAEDRVAEFAACGGLKI